MEDIAVGNSIVAYHLPQVRTERLQYGEDDSAVRRDGGVALYIVEATIGVGVVLLVQTVEVHHAKQLLAFDVAFRKVLYVGSYRVVAVHDV